MSSNGQVRIVHHDHDPKYNCCCGVHVKTCATLLAIWYSFVVIMSWTSLLTSTFRRNEGYGVNFLQTFIILTFIFALCTEKWQFVWPIRIYHLCAIVGLLIGTVVLCVMVLTTDPKTMINNTETDRKNSSIYAHEYINSTTSALNPMLKEDQDNLRTTILRAFGGFMIVIVIFVAAMILAILIFCYRIVTNYQNFAKEKAKYLNNQEAGLTIVEKV